MPAQKRESDPHEPQPKLRKLDEDGEALPSKIGPATNSLITGQIKEKTESAPRTKKKRSSSGEGESLPAKSSKQDSLPEECGKTTSDPPLLKAKLLKATSASCGEAPSQRANSNASLKRSASTESDDDLSSDGSKADFFRERDDEDEARCIRKYSSKAEESSDLHEGLPSSPADPVQMDHNYGRFSDATSPESTEDSNVKISSAEFFSEQGKQETPHDAKEKVSSGTSEPETRSIEASVTIDSAAEESKHNEFKDLESHILLGNKASACSGEVLDSVTSVGEENEKTDQAESIRSQKDVDNETIAQSEETLCCTVVEVTSSGRGDEAEGDETDLTFRSENQTHLSDQSVSEEDDQSIRCKLKDGGVAGQLDEVQLNKATSSPEQVEISKPLIETEENVTTSEHVAIPETQTELKVQVSSAEELNAADAVVSFGDDVNNALEKSEETLEESVQEPADVPLPASCPGPLVEGEPNHFFVISDSCTDTSPECKSVHGENQIEMLAENNLVPEGQMTPEVDLQSQENHLVYDGIAKAAAEVEEDVVISHCSASPDTQIQEDCNPDVTVETQSQEVYESATTVSTYVYKDDVEKLRENTECESLETLTVEASEISGPVPASAEIHDDGVTADECENSLEHAGPAEGQSAMETQTVDVEIQEGPVGEPITDEDQKDPENTNSTSSEAADCVEASAESLVGVELQNTTVSEETRNEEMHIRMNQEVGEHTSDIDIEAQRGVQNENGAAQVQISRDVEAVVSSEEASNVMEEAEDTQMVSKPTADVSNKSQTVWEDKTFKNCEESESVSAAVQSQTEVGEEAKATSEEASNVASIEEMQTQMVSEPTTHLPEETHRDLEKANCVAQCQIEDGVEAVVSSEEASDVMEEAEETQMVSKPTTDVWEDAAAAQSQTEVGEEAKITSEEASDVALIEEMQTQMVSEPLTGMPEETHKEPESSTLKTSDEMFVSAAAQSQTEDGVEADVSSEKASDVMEEAEETQMVSKPITDVSNKTQTVWENAVAAAVQSQTEVDQEAKATSEVSNIAPIKVIQSHMISDAHREMENTNCVAQIQIEDHVETKITSEEASNISSIEEMQIQLVSEPLTGISEETYKEPESSTLKTSDEMFVSAAAQSQTEDQEEAKSTSDELPKIAPVHQVQTQMVSEPVTHMSVGLLENNEENVKTAENNEVGFESVAVTPCQMEVEDQSYPTSSVGVNKIQTEVNTQMGEKSSNTDFVIGSQTQTNLDFGGQTKDDTSEDIHADMMVENPQNMENDNEINSENVTEQENQTQQFTAESEIAEAARLVEMQSENNQNETSEQVSAEESQNQKSQRVGEQITDVEFVNVAECQNKTETSQLSAETLIHKSLIVTEPDVSQQQSLRGSSDEDENNVTENQVDVAESPNETQKQAAEMFEDISQPTSPEQTQSLVDQEVSELIRDTQGLAETQIPRSLGPKETVKDLPEQVEEKSRIPSMDIAEMTNKTEVAEALEEIPLPPATELTQVQRGQEVIKSVGASENHPITDMQTSAEFDQNQRCEEEADESVDEAVSGCENVPGVLMETSASEHQNHLAEEPVEHSASDMKTTLSVNVDTKDEDVQVEPDDVISGPLGSDENKVKVDERVSNMEGGAESSDVIVFVCDQSDVQAPEEQMKPVNQEFHDNQVVYEPISSPESNSGGGVCTTMELGETISFLDLQNTETHHTASGESRILTSDDTVEAALSNQEEEIVTAEICVPESQAAAEMEVDTISEAQLEQNNTTEAFEQVAAVSSSDDIGVAEDATEKRETPAEVTETVQDDAAAAPASDEAEVPDGSSEEYVILEPVPEDNIHFDIVTQAVAESGLSASLCPGDVSGDEIANQNVIKDPQQAEVKEDVTADGGECPVFTSSGDVLDQEMETNVPQDVPNSYHPPSSTSEGTDITNSHSQHTVEDTGLMVVENEKCHLDLQQVQILEDIEIGHEIVVAEEENEENGNITAIKPPDQPTEVFSEKSDQKVNDKANETTKQSKTEDEEKVFEVPKPKKQEMNTQARTKARMAALAREKAAASKRSANRQQLNLLALCQEIAEDIATDSNLLKKIEEEKQAVAAAEAAKAEARQKELPPAVSEEADPASVAAPAEPEETSGSVTPAPEPSPAQPSTAADDSAATKPAADPPKRRFFISQISVPLKAHEKKKLTRYQRLRQVELQREKMSWARVKKLKSDQANQMFSDVDWQASFSGGFLMSPPTPPPAPSPPKTSPTSPAETSQPAHPKAEAPTAETPTAEPAQSEPPIPETSKTEPPKPESSETEPVKAEKSKTEPPPRENRRSTRQSKALASQAAAAPAPAPKVTRSASKKTLPATPPPMPNGLNAQKQKPVEYKPYRPRPKYSPDDFELDDDDLLLASPARPRPQQSPASPQPTNQTRLKPHTAPPGQISGQSKPTAAAQAQLKPTQSKPSVTATPPPKPASLKSPEPVSPSGRPKPAASAPPQLKTSIGAKPSDSVASETKPAAAAAQKTENLSSQEKQKSQKTADPLPSVECSKVSNEKCEEKPAVTTSSSAPENNSEPAETEDQPSEKPQHDGDTKPQESATHLTEASLQKEVKKLKEADKDSSQTIIDAGQKHFGPVACSMCGMLYSAANPEDESQHLLFHNQFISAVKYVGWKKERILAEFPDGKIILVLPDDPKYALKKVEEIREMVDNDLGFQQVETKCPSQTKTFLFISIDKKVAGCLIAENIQEGYRVIEEPVPEGSEGEKVMFEHQRAWCCSTTPEPAICGISRIWVVSMMRRRGIATRMIECLRNNFIYGSYLSKDEIAFSDPTPDGKLFAMHYFGTSQFLVYNFVSGPRSSQPKTHAV